ncbi:hypothetical protein D3C80_680200 [compost metagenome]
MSKNVIESRIKKLWFKPSVIRYDVVSYSEEWCGPYDSDRVVRRVLGSFKTEADARVALDCLNKFPKN